MLGHAVSADGSDLPHSSSHVLSLSRQCSRRRIWRRTTVRASTPRNAPGRLRVPNTAITSRFLSLGNCKSLGGLLWEQVQ